MFLLLTLNRQMRTEIFESKFEDDPLTSSCSKLTIKSPERRHWRLCGVFIVSFEHISQLVLVFLLLTLNRQMRTEIFESKFEDDPLTSSALLLKKLSWIPKMKIIFQYKHETNTNFSHLCWQSAVTRSLLVFWCFKEVWK